MFAHAANHWVWLPEGVTESVIRPCGRQIEIPLMKDAKVALETHIYNPSVSIRIITLRGEAVVLDRDLATLFSATLKELRGPLRCIARKSLSRYAFSLTSAEFEELKTRVEFEDMHTVQRRPWAFSERGVIFIAANLDVERARQGLEHAVEAFIQARTQAATIVSANDVVPTSQICSHEGPTPSPTLQTAIERVMETLLEPEASKAVRQETEEILLSATAHLKARLAKAGLENERTAAEISKILAQVETEKAASAKAHAEAERERLGVVKEKLALIGLLSRYLHQGDESVILHLLKGPDGSPP